MNSEMEQIIMQLIMNGGDARSHSLRAIQSGEKGNFEEAYELLDMAKESMNKAHEVQTTLIQEEVRGEGHEVSLLMVHAQDHVMNAMTVRDLAEHVINNQREISELKKQFIKNK